MWIISQWIVRSGVLASSRLGYGMGRERGRRNDDPLVCFCFEHRATDLRRDALAHGRSLIRDEIRAACKAGLGDCANKNPSGRCCLAQVGAVVKTVSVELSTERLHLRPWRDDDLPSFAAINADARVARYLPSTLDRAQSDALAARIRQGFVDHGFGLWAVDRTDRREQPFIGFIGLSVPTFEAPFTPCVEIGWRLAADHWGQGLATEGARAVAEHAFGTLGLDELVSFTVADNRASRRVMEKLGMRHDPQDDFEHPRMPQGHPLRHHLLYRLAAS
jgi:RimJ/RimL family protein N-acetyltransferase